MRIIHSSQLNGMSIYSIISATVLINGLHTADTPTDRAVTLSLF